MAFAVLAVGVLKVLETEDWSAFLCRAVKPEMRDGGISGQNYLLERFLPFIPGF